MATILEALGTRVTPEEKNEFRRTCKAIGTTPAGALRIFVACFNNNQGFPFEVKNTRTPVFDMGGVAVTTPIRDKNGVLAFDAGDYCEDDDVYDVAE